jgi:hypothetical protein
VNLSGIVLIFPIIYNYAFSYSWLSSVSVELPSQRWSSTTRLSVWAFSNVGLEDASSLASGIFHVAIPPCLLILFEVGFTSLTANVLGRLFYVT